MKIKFFLPLTFLLLCGCSQSPKEDQEIIKNAREEVIKLDQKYNQLYQVVMMEYMRGDSRYESAALCLQEITKELMSVNKALKIDCKQYNENGEPTMLQDKDGSLSPIEIIPNELKIEN